MDEHMAQLESSAFGEPLSPIMIRIMLGGWGFAMNVEERIEKSFRSLLTRMSYQKITVSAICEDAGIARKTFYVHFTDKEALVAHIFKRDVVMTQSQLRELLPRDYAVENAVMFNVKLYQSVLAEKDFYIRLVGPMRGVDDTFLRVATNIIYEYNLMILDERGTELPAWERDYTAYFFGSSQAMLMQKWISDGMEIPPEKLGELYSRLALGYWRDRNDQAQFPSYK